MPQPGGKIQRFLRANSVLAADTVILPGSEQPGFGRSALLRPGIADVLRFNAGWTITAGVNDKIDFFRSGVKVATIVPGHYATGTAMAAAIVAALEAADSTPVWVCTWGAVSPGMFRISSDLSFILEFATGANFASSVHRDIGFGDVGLGSTLGVEGIRPAYQSRHWVALTLSQVLATSFTINTTNNKLDFNRGGVKVATIASGVYSGPELATAMNVALNVADPGTWQCSYSETYGFIIQRDPVIVTTFVLLTLTGANLATAIWETIGFRSGVADSASIRFKVSDFLPLTNASHASSIIRGFNISAGGTCTLQMHTSALAGTGLNSTTPSFSKILIGNTERRSTYYATQTFRYARLVIDDISNDAGYNELGVFYIGPFDQPIQMVQDGFVVAKEHLTEVSYGDDGPQHANVRARRNVYRMTWKLLNAATQALFEEIDRTHPPGVPFFLALDAEEDPTNIIYGFLRAGLDIQYGVGVIRIVNMEFAESLP